MSDVQVTIWFGREAGDDCARIFPVSDVGSDNLVYKIGGWRIGIDHGEKSISYGASSLQPVEVLPN